LLSADTNWVFILRNGGSTSLTGAQVAVGTTNPELDLTDPNEFDFISYYPSSVPNSGGSVLMPCPAPSATYEICPSPGATIPPQPGSIDVQTGVPNVGVPTTMTTGYDSSVLVGPETNGDSPVTVAVTLNDPRYAASPDENGIHVNAGSGDVDETSPPTVTANGTALPACVPSSNATCVDPTGFTSYQYSLPGGGSVTCNGVWMSIEQAEDTTPATQYAFNFEENEQGTGGCPTGTPGVSIQVFPAAPASSEVACTDGTDCQATIPVSGLGNVTTSVGPGQGVTGFNYTQGPGWGITFGSTTAPPTPSGSVSSAVGSSTDPTGDAVATDDDTTADAAGEGVVTVSYYGSDPVSSPPFCGASTPPPSTPPQSCSSGEYFDIETAAGSSFSTVTVTDCNLGGGDSLDWWNGTGWTPVSPTPSYSTPSTGPSPCATVELSSTSSPSISQLGGTMFAVIAKPVLTVMTKTLHIRDRTKTTAELACAHRACKGSVSITQRQTTTEKKAGKTVKVTRTVLLGKTSYSIAAGKHATETIDLNKAGRLALGRASKIKRLHATLKVTLTDGSSVSTTVAVN